LTGDTLVAVADGRGSVSFKQLADEGSDVPVYTSDESGNVVIRTMRNPRCTGVSVPVMKVTIEGGHSFKATPNHKLPLLDGRTVEVKDLQPGDQLQIMKRVDRRLVELNPKIRTQNKNGGNFFQIFHRNLPFT
jgi:intein/homing endonuclease